MTKRSKFELAQRQAEDQRMREIEAAWRARLSPDVAEAFRSEVAVAQARPRPERRPDMAPGTLPNPPRPGHEPRPSKNDEQRRPRR